MGAVILSGGAKGKRAILPHGEVMIHLPSGGMEGQASELLIAAEHIKDTKQMINTILSENCNKTYEMVAMDTERDCWLRANGAKEYGIVDMILGEG